MSFCACIAPSQEFLSFLFFTFPLFGDDSQYGAGARAGRASDWKMRSAWLRDGALGRYPTRVRDVRDAMPTQCGHSAADQRGRLGSLQLQCLQRLHSASRKHLRRPSRFISQSSTIATMPGDARQRRAGGLDRPGWALGPWLLLGPGLGPACLHAAGTTPAGPTAGQTFSHTESIYSKRQLLGMAAPR